MANKIYQPNLDLRRENNPRWNGGSSEYPNHYLLKLNRFKKLQLTKGRCEICNSIAQAVHHLDGNKSNHSLINLVALCRKCHFALHNEDRRKPKGTSKFKRLYGKTLTEIAKEFGCSTTKAINLHRKSKLELLRRS